VRLTPPQRRVIETLTAAVAYQWDRAPEIGALCLAAYVTPRTIYALEARGQVETGQANGLTYVRLKLGTEAR